MVRTMDDWECYDCKKCSGCRISRKNDNDMLICDRCDRSFHPHCCKPPVKKPPDGELVILGSSILLKLSNNSVHSVMQILCW